MQNYKCNIIHGIGNTQVHAFVDLKYNLANALKVDLHELAYSARIDKDTEDEHHYIYYSNTQFEFFKFIKPNKGDVIFELNLSKMIY